MTEQEETQAPWEAAHEANAKRFRGLSPAQQALLLELVREAESNTKLHALAKECGVNTLTLLRGATGLPLNETTRGRIARVVTNHRNRKRRAKSAVSSTLETGKDES